MQKCLLAAFAATMMCGSADAALITYNVAGIFEDGATLGGHFTSDNAGRAIDQLSNVYLTVSSLATPFTSITTGELGATNPSLYGLRSSYDPTYISIDFVALRGNGFAILGIIGTDLLTSTRYAVNGEPAVNLRVGTITIATDVPEPASWAMMIGGFGAIGAAMRLRKVAVRFG